MAEQFQTHMFWPYGNFSNVERISTKSFLRHGYQLNIWTYEDFSGAPSGATLKDAREVLPESQIFSMPSGSYAPVSDIFRYTVLNKIGGLWVDADVVALKPFKESLAQPFLVTERLPVTSVKELAKKILGRSSPLVAGNVLFNPVPTPGNIIDLACNYSERFPKEKIRWGELGPNLLNAIEKIYPDHGFKVMKPEFANSIDYWNCPRALLKPGPKLHPDAAFLHLYNQTWREAGIDKNAPFPEGGLMALFAREYL